MVESRHLKRVTSDRDVQYRDRRGTVRHGVRLQLECGHIVFRAAAAHLCREAICNFCAGKPPSPVTPLEWLTGQYIKPMPPGK